MFDNLSGGEAKQSLLDTTNSIALCLAEFI